MAMATTHDLPTLAGLWTGRDLAAQECLDPPANEEVQKLRRHYGQLLGLPADAPVEGVIEATYRLLAQAPSAILLATLEDALAVVERPNMPGTTNAVAQLAPGLARRAGGPGGRRAAAPHRCGPEPAVTPARRASEGAPCHGLPSFSLAMRIAPGVML